MAKPQRDIRQLRPFLSMPKSGFANKGRAVKYEKKVFHLFSPQHRSRFDKFEYL